METPYLDREIKILEEGLKDKTNSFYQNRKLVEYKEIKKQLALLRVSQRSELLPKRLSNEAYNKAQVMTYDGFVQWWDDQQV